MNIQKLGRTFLFYLVFYSALAGLFSTMLALFFLTLTDTIPKLQLDDSCIGSNPGMALRPMPPNVESRSPLIWYNFNDWGNVAYWKNELDKFLMPYTTPEQSGNVQNCDHLNQPDENNVCEFKLTNNFAPCTREFSYGFDSYGGGPCIFLKLNKIFGWVPEYYNSTTVQSMQSMPDHLKKIIETQELFGMHHVIWVDCQGKNPADVVNIGPINYHPQRGFHQKYFPFTNIKGYVSPLVAVHFEKPARGVLINIECKAWARNIHHDGVDGRGSVHFELMIE